MRAEIFFHFHHGSNLSPMKKRVNTAGQKRAEVVSFNGMSSECARRRGWGGGALDGTGQSR